MSGQTNSQNNIQEIFPVHPYFPELSEVYREVSLLQDTRYCVDEYIQLIQFWQFNVASANAIINENSNEKFGENQNILKEYLFSLLDLPVNFHSKNSFFANELLSNSINANKRKAGISKRTIGMMSFNNLKNNSLINDEEITMPENKDTFNEDVEVLESDDESDFDYEYMNSGANEDYDELEDNTNDNDVI